MKDIRLFLIIFVTALFSSHTVMATEVIHGYKPPNGFVPDKKTAIAIAEAVWIPIYGHKKIIAQRPFNAILENGVWKVSGTLPGHDLPGRILLGGTAQIEISKSRGTILKVWHSK